MPTDPLSLTADERHEWLRRTDVHCTVENFRALILAWFAQSEVIAAAGLDTTEEPDAD